MEYPIDSYKYNEPFLVAEDGTMIYAYKIIKTEQRNRQTWVLLLNSKSELQNPRYKPVLLPRYEDGFFWISFANLMITVGLADQKMGTSQVPTVSGFVGADIRNRREKPTYDLIRWRELTRKVKIERLIPSASLDELKILLSYKRDAVRGRKQHKP